jgi:hypothetical protein
LELGRSGGTLALIVRGNEFNFGKLDYKGMTTSQTAPTEQQRNPLASLPLLLAIAASFIQLASVFPIAPSTICILVGLAVSIGAIVCGHIIYSRIKRLELSGERLALFGLVAAYLTLLIVPVLLGILFFSFWVLHDAI